MVNIYFFYTVTVIIFTVLACYVFTLKAIDEKEKRQIEREEIFKKWLFDSLYSINHNVKLPEEKIEIIAKKASVYIPENDPMSEFKGDLDDWH